VTRGKAIEVMESWVWMQGETGKKDATVHWESTLDDVEEALDMAIAALREQPRWISVEERLPEVGVTVLTLDKHGHICDRYMYRCSDGTALFTAKHLVSSKDVTHWMPMPGLPEVEG
jgi:hypothetical protein